MSEPDWTVISAAAQLLEMSLDQMPIEQHIEWACLNEEQARQLRYIMSELEYSDFTEMISRLWKAITPEGKNDDTAVDVP